MAPYTACVRAFVAAAPALEELSLTLLTSRVSLGELLAPILLLSTIRRFTYAGGARHVGTDADIVAIARAWGRGLEVLQFDQRASFWEKTGPVPSAIALSSLRASCPRLVDLLLPPLDPSLEKLASADARGADEHVHPLDILTIRLWETQTKGITDDMRRRWEAYLIRLFPKLADREGDEVLLMGELLDQPRRICLTVFDSESESSDDDR